MSYNQNYFPEGNSTLPQPMQNQLAYQAELDAIKTNHGVAAEVEKAAIAIKKNEAMTEMSLEAEATRLMLKEDVRTRRELMKTGFEFEANGVIKISQQMFGGDMKDTPPFRVWDICLLKNPSTDEEILTFLYELKTGKSGFIHIDTNQMDERYINQKFNAAGISFGFSHGKETIMRQKLVTNMISIAPVKVLPMSRGWYESEGRPKFCFPEDYTFEEARKYV